MHPHLEVTIPTGRAIGPLSGANWEGVGVQPDIEVPAGQALERAHELARAAIHPVLHQAGPGPEPAGSRPAA